MRHNINERDFSKGDSVVAIESFDEFVQVGPDGDEMKAVTIKAGDVGRFVRVSYDGTFTVDFDGFTIDVWPHMIRASDHATCEERLPRRPCPKCGADLENYGIGDGPDEECTACGWNNGD